MTDPTVVLALIVVGLSVGLYFERRLRVLAIPFALLYGLAVGQAGLGALTSGPLVETTSEVALALLLFLTSLVGNPRAVREGGRVALPLAGYDLVLNFAVAWWIGGFFGWEGPQRLLLGGILASSSTAVALKLAGDEGWLGRREGSVLVSLLFFEDWFFLVLFGALSLHASVGAVHFRTLAVALVAFASFLVLLRMARARLWAIGSKEVLVPALVAIALGAAFLGRTAGLPAVACAFTAGLALSGERAARFIRADAPWMREAASALFFVTYGALLSPFSAASVWPLLGLCVLGVLLTEGLFLPILAYRLGLSARDALAMGASLLARGGKSSAFARLSISAAPGTPLFALGGLLALVLTPLAPLGVWFARGAPSRHRPDELRRTTRGLLLPHEFRQRTPRPLLGSFLLTVLVLVAAASAGLAFVLTGPLRGVAAAVAIACVPWIVIGVRRRVDAAPRWSPSRPYARRPWVSARDAISILLVGPVALLATLALGASGSVILYPVILGGFAALVTAGPVLLARRRRSGLPRGLRV